MAPKKTTSGKGGKKGKKKKGTKPKRTSLKMGITIGPPVGGP